MQSPDRHAKALRTFAGGTFIPAVPLALDADRQFDEAAQRRLVRYYLEAGAGGLAVAVHTTQFAIRKPEAALLEPVLRAAAEEIDRFEAETGRVIVRVAGACGHVAQAVEEARLAGRLGYDAVLLSPGGLNKLTELGLLTRTRAVAQVMPVIGFYLQPSVGGRRLGFDYWRRLYEIENVIGVKCASFDRYSTLDVVRAAAASEVTLYTGNDDNIVVDLLTPYRFTIGGETVTKRFAGGLLGHWAVCTRTAVKLFEEIKRAAAQPDIPVDLLRLAAEVTDFNAAVFDVKNGFRGCIPGVHEVLRRQGLLEGIWCLDPKEVLSEGQAAEISRVMAMYPHLCDEGQTRA